MTSKVAHVEGRAKPRRRVVPAVAIGLPALLGVVLIATAASSAPPDSSPRSVVAAAADSTGPIVVDGSGNGYVAWASSNHNGDGDPLYFCKLPPGGRCSHAVKLPIPAADRWDDFSVNQPFPVLGGKAGVVSVVGPSYDRSDVVVWTSHNHGKTFGEPQVIADDNYDGTSTDDVLRSPDADAPYYPDYFSVASTNPGLFYTFTGIGAIGAPDPPSGFEQDTSGVTGAVTVSTLGYGKTVDPGPNQSTQTVEAFSTDADRPRLDFFWSPVPGVSGSPGALEHGPTAITIGINPRLAGGPDGLYLLSEDYVASPDNDAKPLHLDVRKWDPSTHRFGKPTLVATVTNDIESSNAGGFAEDASTGVLTVARPSEASSGEVMDIWTSANGGKSFSGPTKVATVGYGYVGPARIATVNDRGFLTWQDHDGLELVALSHL